MKHFDLVPAVLLLLSASNASAQRTSIQPPANPTLPSPSAVAPSHPSTSTLISRATNPALVRRYASPTSGGFSYLPVFGWDAAAQPAIYFPPAPTIPAPLYANPIVEPIFAAARLSLEVPLGADVWLQGVKVDPFVGKRIFESPPLPIGAPFPFDLRVAWVEDGKVVDQKERIILRSGEHRGLLFMAAPGSQPTKGPS